MESSNRPFSLGNPSDSPSWADAPKVVCSPTCGTRRVPTIETLTPVRTLWPHEAGEFTAWLHDSPEILGDPLNPRTE